MFARLFVSFFFSTEGNNLGVDGISYYLYVCVFGVCILNVDLFYDHFCAGREKFLKAIAVGLLRCHLTITKKKKKKKERRRRRKKDGATIKRFHT